MERSQKTIDERLVITEDGTRHLIRPPGFGPMMPYREPDQVKKTRAAKKSQEQGGTPSTGKDPWTTGSDPWSAGRREQVPHQPPAEPKAAPAQLKSRESAAEEKQQRKQEILRSEIVLARCSALYFEESPHSESSGHNTFQVHIGFGGRNPDVHFDLSLYKTKRSFEQSFRRHFPQLCKDRRMTVIDCTQIDVQDFTEIENTAEHTGYHPTILLHCAQAFSFGEIMQPLSSLKLVDKMQLVVFVSRRGSHRAVAALDLVDHACEWLHYCFDDTSIRLE